MLKTAALASATVLLAMVIWRNQRRTRNKEEEHTDFDRGVERSHVHTVKHGLARCIYDGAPGDALSMWVADMGAFDTRPRQLLTLRSLLHRPAMLLTNPSCDTRAG
jgi:hypothetical protein